MDRCEMDGNGECNENTLTNVAGQVRHALTQFAAHSTTVEAAGLPVAAAFGFMPGLILGLRKG